MKSKYFTFFLIFLLFNITESFAQSPNFEVIEPGDCVPGFCQIDFPDGPVELGLTSSITVTIKNSGTIGGPLTISSLNLVSSSGDLICPNCNYYEIFQINGTDFTGDPFLINSTEEKNITINFNPALDAPIGNLAVKLRVEVVGDDPANPPIYPDAYDDSSTTDDDLVLDVDIKLNGISKKTVNNICLVLDRSYSMSAIEGTDVFSNTVRRMDILADAVNLFLGLEQTRIQTGDYDGDKLAMVRYNHNVDPNYLNLEPITVDFLENNAEYKVNDAAISAGGDMYPAGYTATGQAVMDALNTQFSSDGGTTEIDGNNIMILFSDGIETVPPYYNSGVLTTRLDNTNVSIYSIGMGDANFTSLNSYSALSGLGYPQAFPVADYEVDPSALNKIFLQIYQDATDYEFIADPTYYVDLINSTRVTIADAWITSSETKVIFSITHPRDTRSWVGFEILTPSGKVLDEGAIDGLTTQKIEGRNYLIYDVTFEDQADSADYVGNWKLQGWGFKVPAEGTDTSLPEPDRTSIPIGFATLGQSNLDFDFIADVPSGTPGSDLVITTNVNDNSSDDEVEIETFDVTIIKPNGEKIKVLPVKDKFGVLSVRYPHTQIKGIYEVIAKATFKNSKGEKAIRYARNFTVVEDKPVYTPVEEPCLSCPYIKTIIAISIIILVIILIVAIRRRRKYNI